MRPNRSLLPSSRRRSVLAALLPLSLLLGLAPVSAEPRLHLSAEQFLDGELDGLAIDELGQLRLAPVSATVFPTDGLYAWALALDAQGRVVVGTGDEGRLFRIDDDEVEPLADTEAMAVLSLLSDGDAMLAGTSPDGQVLRVDEDGEVSLALETDAQSVWALAPGSREGTFLAGTGPGAKVVRGGGDSTQGETLHELAASNTTVLLRDGGGLWIATEGPGSLYRVEGDDASTARLLFESPEEEIRALAPDGRGGVFALSLRPEANESDGASNRITHVDAEGRIEEIRAGDEALVSMAAGPEGTVLVGELETGHVGRVDRQGRLSIWADIDGDPVSMLVDGPRTWIGSGNLGSVVRLAPSRQGRGSWRSAALSTPRVQRWGRAWADGFGEDLSIRARSGVRDRPDPSWSEWSDHHDLDEELDVPPAPYLQVEVRLGEGATLDGLELSWTERNLAPRVHGLRVEPRGRELFFGGGNGGPEPLHQTFDDGLQVDYSYQPPPEPAPPEVGDWVRGIRTLVWQGEDPNGDPLRFEVQTRREPDGAWITRARNVTGRVWAWDTRSVEDGGYRVRVVADDGLGHPPGEELRGEQVGGLIHVDNARPLIEDLRWEGSRLSFVVRDGASPLRDVALRVEDGDWRPLLPVDRVIDSARERFDLEVSDTHPRWWLRAVDAAGNATLRALVRDGTDVD